MGRKWKPSVWRYADRVMEMYRDGMTRTAIAMVFRAEGITTTYKTIGEIIEAAGEAVPEPVKKKTIWEHTDRIMELHRKGLYNREIVAELAKDGVKSSINTVKSVITRNTETKLGRLTSDAWKKPSYPTFKKSSEYLFTVGKVPTNKNSQPKESVFIFMGEIKSRRRKYPLYLFCNKYGGWRETFTPEQLRDFHVSPTGKQARR